MLINLVEQQLKNLAYTIVASVLLLDLVSWESTLCIHSVIYTLMLLYELQSTSHKRIEIETKYNF